MLRSDDKKINFLAYLGCLLFFAGLFIIVASLLSAYIIKHYVPNGVLELSKLSQMPGQSTLFEILNALMSIVTFLIPPICISLIFFKKAFAPLGFNAHITKKEVLWLLCMIPLVILFADYLTTITNLIPLPKQLLQQFKTAEDKYLDTVLSMAIANNIGQYFISLCAIALLPAIVEETFFRGSLQFGLIGLFKNKWAGIILTSIIFSAIHLSYFGFLARFTIGVFLGLIYYYGKSIWLNILFHFINNSVSVTALYVLHLMGKTKEEIKQTMGADSSVNNIWVGIGVFVLLLVIVQFFIKATEQKALIGSNEVIAQ
ncbi:MAG: type II CAAX endopeptidase family protein [Phycisphaerales bacterium]|nr:type II CAAX endopeptidase family protein [Phycisphaerales bacterium]